MPVKASLPLPYPTHQWGELIFLQFPRILPPMRLQYWWFTELIKKLNTLAVVPCGSQGRILSLPRDSFMIMQLCYGPLPVIQPLVISQ